MVSCRILSSQNNQRLIYTALSLAQLVITIEITQIQMNEAIPEFSDANRFVANVLRYLGDEVNKAQTFMSIVKEQRGRNMDPYQALKEIIRLIQPHKSLINELNNFLPPVLQVTPQVVGYPLHQDKSYDDALEYLKKIKQQASNVYLDFIDILKKYQDKKCSIKSMIESVFQFLRPYPTLLEKFEGFLPELVSDPHQQNDAVAQEAFNIEKKKLLKLNKPKTQQPPVYDAPPRINNKNETMFFEQMRQQIGDTNYHMLMNAFSIYIEGIAPAHEILDLISPLFKGSEEYFQNFKNIVYSREVNRRNNSWFCKALSEQSLSECQLKGVSYRRLPKDYPNPVSSGRSELEILVCNDFLVSVPIRSEDFGFKQKNTYEDNLFKCEDDRYQIDHAMKNLESTIFELKQTLDSINQLSDQDKSKYQLPPKCFSQLRYSCVAYVYGEHGEEMIKHLRKNPIKAIPIILDRMKKKLDNWRDARNGLLNTWKEICEKNFIKSLDHRSFAFKNTEKKNMNQKFFTSEVKDRQKSKTSDTLNQQRGGVQEYEFFTTFSNIGKSLTHILDPQIDHSDPVLLTQGYENNEPLKMPHYRMILNRESDLQLMLKLLFAVINTSNSNTNEKDKQRSFFTKYLKTFFGYNISQDLENFQLTSLTETQIGFLIDCEYYKKIGKDGKIDIPDYEINWDIDNCEQIFSEEQDQSYEEGKPNRQRFNNDSNIDQESHFYPVLRDYHNLFYGTQQYYVMLKMMFTLYERIIKIKELINNKVNLDIQETDLTSDQISTIKKQKTELFFQAIISLQKGLEPGKFEDLGREFLGNQAYLTFIIDKMILQVIKNIQALSTEDLATKSFQLYDEFRKQRYQKENAYCSRFNQTMRDSNNYNGLAFRFLYSPQAKVLSIHHYQNTCFSTSEKCLPAVKQEFDHFFTSNPSSDNLQQLSHSRTFLTRNLNFRKEPAIYAENNLEMKFAYQNSKIEYEPETQDFMVSVGNKRRASENEIFDTDIRRTFEFKNRFKQ